MSQLFDSKKLDKNNVGKVENDDVSERFKVVNEIVNSEKKYVEQINVLNSLYIVPLESAADHDCIISRDKINSIFGNISVIKNLNGIFFYKMKERILVWNKESQIADIFIDFGPYFKIYMSYANNQEVGTKKLREELKNNPRFKEFCDQKFNHPMAQKQNLSSFLILPIQRVPRYLLLLRDLLKKTPKTHLDYKPLGEAIELITEVVHKIEHSIVEQENSNFIYDLQESFLDGVTLIEPGRKYLHEGVLNKICRSSTKKYNFILFNNLLVYASKSGTKYKMHRMIPIDAVFQVHEVPDNEKISHCFQISSSKKSFMVYAESRSSKKQWLDIFSDLIDKVAMKVGDASIASSKSMAPVWQQDFSSNECKICQSKFSMFTRRHHCRKCGQLVCHNCSKTRSVIKEIDSETLLRICDECVRKLPHTEDDNAVNKAVKQCVVLYKYVPRESNELRMEKGQIVTVVKEDPSGWWTGMIEGQVGVFPSNYVQEETSETISKKSQSDKKKKTNILRSFFASSSQETPSQTTSQTDSKTKSQMSEVKKEMNVPSNSEKMKERLVIPKAPPKPLKKDIKTPPKTPQAKLDEKEPPKPIKNRSKSSSDVLEGCGPGYGKCSGLVEKEKNVQHHDILIVADQNVEDFSTDKLSFKMGNRLILKFYNNKNGWCYCQNRETGKIGWVQKGDICDAEDFPSSEEQKKLKLHLPCSCKGFLSNAFRNRLCKNCFHTVDFHPKVPEEELKNNSNGRGSKFHITNFIRDKSRKFLQS